MEYIVNAEEMRRCDTKTIEKFHMPAMVLMERAALSVVQTIKTYWKKGSGTVLIAAGNGNNGADGIAVGRLLQQDGFEVTFFTAGESSKHSRLMEGQLAVIKAYGYEICTGFPEGEYDIIVDALFGIGITRTVEGTYAECIEKINKSKAVTFSVDMPSGIHTDTGAVMGQAVKADVTVTFAYRKLGLVLYPGCNFAGEVTVKQIGITKESFEGELPEVFCYNEQAAALLGERKRDGNKGTFGKVLVIAGNKTMGGASALSAEAAFRTGCGMVRILTVKENRQLLSARLPEAILDLYGTEEERNKLLAAGCRWADCILIGPGCGIGEDTCIKLSFLLEHCEKPLVIDADGLNVISQNCGLYNLLKKSIIEKDRTVILTPHAGEFARLTGENIETVKENIPEKTKQYADRMGCVVVCKDARTVVCKKGQKIYLNTSGNCGMATAGSGDVLAGMITGLLAQKMPPFKAAALGVYMHGMAGDMAACEKNEYTILAGDLIRQFDSLFRKESPCREESL